MLPNAGQPRSAPHGVEYPLAPAWFADRMVDLLGDGAAIVGGCCGVAPAHIQALAGAMPSERVVLPATSDASSAETEAMPLVGQSALRDALWAVQDQQDDLIYLAVADVGVGAE